MRLVLLTIGIALSGLGSPAVEASTFTQEVEISESNVNFFSDGHYASAFISLVPDIQLLGLGDLLQVNFIMEQPIQFPGYFNAYGRGFDNTSLANGLDHIIGDLALNPTADHMVQTIDYSEWIIGTAKLSEPFDASSRPYGLDISSAPDAPSWALMMIGFIFSGAALRSRRPTLPAGSVRPG